MDAQSDLSHRRVSGVAQEILCQGPEFRQDHRELGRGRLAQYQYKMITV